MLRKLSQVCFTVLVVGFPFFLWYAGWEHYRGTACYIFAISCFRFFSKPFPQLTKIDRFAVVGTLVMALLVFSLGTGAGLYYPVIVNVGFLALFYTSLSADRNIIQLIAEKTEGRPLDDRGVQYTRMVTRVWCGFFVFNILVSTLLAWAGKLGLWTLYNGVISYVLMGVLLLGEKLLRPRFQNRSPIIPSIDQN